MCIEDGEELIETTGIWCRFEAEEKGELYT
jgi:hypothetical protein